MTSPFTLTLTATKTADDTYDFTVAGITAASAVLDFGDGSAPLTLVPVGGAAPATHVYTRAGHHTYTAVASQVVAPWAATLTEMSTDWPTLTAITADVATLDDITATADTASAAVTVDVGTATLSATLLPDTGPPPAVQIDMFVADPAGVTTWKIYRLDAVFGETLIAAGTATGGAETVLDWDAPLGVEVAYRLDLSDGTRVTSNTVTITGLTGCWLSDPVSSAAMAVQLQSWDVRKAEPRRSVLPVISRRDPVVLMDVPLLPSGEWVIFTRTDAETRTLESILTGSGVALLRTQPGVSIRSVYGAVGEITETRMTNTALDQRRLVTVAIQEISGLTAMASLLGANLAGLATLAGTLAELADVRPTLVQLSQIRVTA